MSACARSAYPYCELSIVAICTVNSNKFARRRYERTEPILLMAFAQQMRIEFVDIVALFATNVTFPWVAFAVAALVQKVQRLIGEFDSAE